MPVTQARLPGFQSAKSARWYQALIGPIQATGSAGGFDSETGGVYVGFGCLAQQGFPYALCRPASRRRVGKERFPSEKIALRRAFFDGLTRPIAGGYFQIGEIKRHDG